MPSGLLAGYPNHPSLSSASAITLAYRAGADLVDNNQRQPLLTEIKAAHVLANHMQNLVDQHHVFR